MMNTQMLFQMLRSSGNPQGILMNILKESSNPIASNVISMINNNDAKGIENIARNIAKSKGINVDELKSSLQHQFKC